MAAAAAAAVAVEVATEAGRLASFNGQQQVAKRRASATKKKTQSAVSWPHKTPSPEDLAHAGFYFRPTPESTDSVTCFLCQKSLDGWEAEDNPIKEHLAHVPDCGWAVNVAIGQRANDEHRQESNPMDADLVEARLATFRGCWPHDGKRGWKCTSKKLANAGWCYSPIPEADDCVVCFYCNCSLDGWEPKDDPWEEHHRRAPECPFFSLTQEAKQAKPTRGKKGAKSRSSKTSRASTQSNSTMLAEDSVMDNTLLATAAEDDDTVLTEASTTSTAGRKKPAARKPRATRKAKGAKQEPVEAEVEAEVNAVAANVELEQGDDTSIEAAPKPKPKRATRGKKQSVQPDAIDGPLQETKPARKPRGKKASALAQDAVPKGSKAEDLAATEANDALDLQVAPSPPPPPPQTKPSRGRKRKSDGSEKPENSVLSVIEVDAPKIPPKSQKRTTKQPKTVDSQSSQVQSTTTQAGEEVEEEKGNKEQFIEPDEAETAPTATKESDRASAAQRASPDAKSLMEAPKRNSRVPAPVEIFQDEAEIAQGPLSPSLSQQSSDAENQPPSSRPSMNTPPAPAIPPRRVPLSAAPAAVAATPKMSPSKRNIAGGLVSSMPWQAVDVEAILARSPSLKALGQENVKLDDVLKSLSSPEKKMTVEEWMLHNAHRSEEELRKECERIINLFESEGNKALRSLEAVQVA